MKIGLDVMGGDYAPESTISGALDAQEVLDEDTEIILFGNRESIEETLSKTPNTLARLTIYQSDDYITMDEYPSKAVFNKPNSTISLGLKELMLGNIDGFASAGNSGAVLVGAMHTVKPISGIIRPGISSLVPKLGGGYAIIIDVGINPDPRPEVMFQFGILGSIYAKLVYNIKSPRVGLLNIGSEERKGNHLTKNSYIKMKGTSAFNFVGNIEGNDIFDNDKADVIVCDGFVGNVILKEAEAIYEIIRKRNIQDEYFEKFNFENYGGTPLLGINSNVVLGHGISNAKAIKNMILHTREVIKANLSQKIKEAFN